MRQGGTGEGWGGEGWGWESGEQSLEVLLLRKEAVQLECVCVRCCIKHTHTDRQIEGWL